MLKYPDLIEQLHKSLPVSRGVAVECCFSAAAPKREKCVRTRAACTGRESPGPLFESSNNQPLLPSPDESTFDKHVELAGVLQEQSISNEQELDDIWRVPAKLTVPPFIMLFLKDSADSDQSDSRPAGEISELIDSRNNYGVCVDKASNLEVI